MKLAQIALIIALSAATAFVVGKYAPPASTAPVKETAFQRVMRTNTLRCGYYTYNPVTIRDPNTGALSGLSVDMMDSFSRKTGIKVEWTEEIAFGNWMPALQAKRFDAVCTPLWPDVARARVAKFSRPFIYTDLLPIVRADEARFGNDLAVFNDPNVTLGAQEGDNSLTLGKALFPKAKFSVLAENGDYTTLLQDLVDKKIDMVPWDRNAVYQFNLQNPGKIKALETKEPLAVMPSELVVGAEEGDLLDLLNALIEEMQNTGESKRLISKWIPTPGVTLDVAKPYDPASYRPFTALDAPPPAPAEPPAAPTQPDQPQPVNK